MTDQAPPTLLVRSWRVILATALAGGAVYTIWSMFWKLGFLHVVLLLFYFTRKVSIASVLNGEPIFHELAKPKPDPNIDPIRDAINRRYKISPWVSVILGLAGGVFSGMPFFGQPNTWTIVLCVSIPPFLFLFKYSEQAISIFPYLGFSIIHGIVWMVMYWASGRNLVLSRPFEWWTAAVLGFVIGLAEFIAFGIISSIVAGFFAKRSARNATDCPQCDYSLIGNSTGVCPECGFLIPANLHQYIQERAQDDSQSDDE